MESKKDKEKREKILEEEEMMDEGGATSESYKNDPRINKDENQRKVFEEQIKEEKSKNNKK